MADALMVPSAAQMVDVLVDVPVTVMGLQGEPIARVTDADVPVHPAAVVAVTV